MLMSITDHHFKYNMKGLDVIAQIAIFLGVMCTVMMGISRRDGDFLMRMINMIMHWVFKAATGKLPTCAAEIFKQTPTTIRSALSRFNLDSRTVIYAVCTTCHCTFEPQFAEGSTLPVYPTHCTNRPTPEADVCNKPLLHNVQEEGGFSAMKPIMPFVYNHFHDYLARLLSRPDLELMMDKACDDLMSTIDYKPRFVTDTWGAQFLRSFEGPTPGMLFVDRKGEGRYVFTMNIDSFNVEGMCIRGASKSCSLISMACLNLAPEIRYKPENIYIAGIIPIKPSLTQLNYSMKPVIDHLTESWQHGVRFSQTALHPEGRDSRSAIAAVVDDLPGGRQQAGLGSTSSDHHCSVCNLRGKATLGDTDHEHWSLRDALKLCEQAENWRNASTLQEQEAIFHKYGTRWSELWRLPYWDPTTQLVVDFMHTVLEGNAQNHFRNILNLTTTAANTHSQPPPAFVQKFKKIDLDVTPFPGEMTLREAKQVNSIHALLVAPLVGDDANVISDQESLDDTIKVLRSRLNSKNIKPLAFVCQDLRLGPTRGSHPNATRVFKTNWVEALILWVGASCGPLNVCC